LPSTLPFLPPSISGALGFAEASSSFAAGGARLASLLGFGAADGDFFGVDFIGLPLP